MDIILFLKAAIMGIVEGFTEFLPISSTGHLILTGTLLNFHDEKIKVFEIAIQTGAIFAVILIYWKKIYANISTFLTHEPSKRLIFNVIIGFLPAVIIALAAGKFIKNHLFTPFIVASAFIVGGFIILLIERRKNTVIKIQNVENMRYIDAFKVGLIQCLGMIPGTSRSGATIMGAMLLGFSRSAATEFSFFLAIPTLIGAGVYSIYKARSILSLQDIPLFLTGLITSFLAAWLCIRWLLRYISTHDFIIFAWYRIAFGIFILISAWQQWVDWSLK